MNPLKRRALLFLACLGFISLFVFLARKQKNLLLPSWTSAPFTKEPQAAAESPAGLTPPPEEHFSEAAQKAIALCLPGFRFKNNSTLDQVWDFVLETHSPEKPQQKVFTTTLIYDRGQSSERRIQFLRRENSQTLFERREFRVDSEDLPIPVSSKLITLAPSITPNELAAHESTTMKPTNLESLSQFVWADRGIAWEVTEQNGHVTEMDSLDPKIPLQCARATSRSIADCICHSPLPARKGDREDKERHHNDHQQP